MNVVKCGTKLNYLNQLNKIFVVLYYSYFQLTFVVAGQKNELIKLLCPLFIASFLHRFVSVLFISF